MKKQSEEIVQREILIQKGAWITCACCGLHLMQLNTNVREGDLVCSKMFDTALNLSLIPAYFCPFCPAGMGRYGRFRGGFVQFHTEAGWLPRPAG